MTNAAETGAAVAVELWGGKSGGSGMIYQTQASLRVSHRGQRGSPHHHHHFKEAKSEVEPSTGWGRSADPDQCPSTTPSSADGNGMKESPIIS